MCFGGPSASEKNLAGNEASLADQLHSDYQTQFAGQQSTLQELSGMLNNNTVLPGWSPPELAAVNTQTIDSNAAAARNATQAANTVGAAKGGSSGLTSGVQQQIDAGIASSAANSLASQQSQITQADYAQGQINKQQTESGLETLAGIQAPVSYANAATGANQAGFSEASTIEQQQQQAQASELGLVTSLAGAAVPGLGNLDTTGGSSGGEQFGNFLSGVGL